MSDRVVTNVWYKAFPRHPLQYLGLTIEQAAVKFANGQGMRKILQTDPTIDLSILGNDPNFAGGIIAERDGTQWELSVETRVTYVVHGLRGGDL